MKNNDRKAPALKLMASPGAWRLYSARKLDKNFIDFEKKVLQRDKYTCQFCGFQATKYQEVVNLDGDFNNNKISNLVTCCCFCSQCFFLESVGVGGYGGGTLIYLPEISQEQLNSFCHVLFCAITNDTGYKSSAQTVYLSFKVRSQQVEDKFGEGTSDPAILGHLIIDSVIDQSNIDNILKGVRLLPSRAKFRKQIEGWAANALEEIAAK
jgi:intracellular multiplication protein IcmJ